MDIINEIVNNINNSLLKQFFLGAAFIVLSFLGPIPTFETLKEVNNYEKTKL